MEGVTPLVRQPNYIAALGDSLTLGDGDRQSYLGNRSFLAWACLLSGGALIPPITGGQGVNGETSGQIAARASSIAALVPRPSRCLVMAGTNDALHGWNEPTYQANIASIVATLRAASIEPILLLCPPNNTAGATIARINAWLSLYGVRNGIQVIDTYTPFQDAATGGYKSGADLDGTHITAVTAKGMGQAIWDALSSRIAPLPPLLLTAHAADPLNLLANGVFVGDTNADGTANSWTNVGANSSDSLVSGGTTVPGNWQKLTLDQASQVFFDQPISAGWSVGDYLLFAGRVRASLSSTETVQARLEYTGSTITRMHILYPNSISIADGDGVVFAGVGQVPVGCTAIRCRLFGTGVSGVGTGTVEFAQITVRNLTTLGLV